MQFLPLQDLGMDSQTHGTNCATNEHCVHSKINNASAAQQNNTTPQAAMQHKLNFTTVRATLLSVQQSSCRSEWCCKYVFK